MAQKFQNRFVGKRKRQYVPRINRKGLW